MHRDVNSRKQESMQVILEVGHHTGYLYQLPQLLGYLYSVFAGYGSYNKIPLTGALQITEMYFLQSGG